MLHTYTYARRGIIIQKSPRVRVKPRRAIVECWIIGRELTPIIFDSRDNKPPALFDAFQMVTAFSRAGDIT